MPGYPGYVISGFPEIRAQVISWTIDQTTVTVPCSFICTRHVYGYTPGLSNFWLKDWPELMRNDRNCLSANWIRCAVLVSALNHLTVEPTLTVTFAWLSWEFMIVISDSEGVFSTVTTICVGCCVGVVGFAVVTIGVGAGVAGCVAGGEGDAPVHPQEKTRKAAMNRSTRILFIDVPRQYAL
jgi:hypothetical protein